MTVGLARATTQQYQHGMVSLERLAAELRLRNGEWTAVRRWVEAQPIFAGRQPDGRWQIVEILNDASYLIYTRLLLHDGRIEEARNLLSLLAASARDGGRVRNLIVVLLLQAVVSAEPLPFMQEAVQRAAAEQYVRLILDECAFPAHGPFLASLLRQTAVRQTAPDFTAVLLAALPEEPTTTRPPTHAPELLEPLTEQEMVVLRLLAAGLSNQQIANELVITVGTAKWHVHNLYQKLGVGSRAAAVARIHEWQLAGA